MKWPQVANHSYTSPARRVRRVARSGRCSLPAILWFLAQKLRLQREDVVEHAIEPAPLEPVLGDDPRMLERAPERGAQRSVRAPGRASAPPRGSAGSGPAPAGAS